MTQVLSQRRHAARLSNKNRARDPPQGAGVMKTIALGIWALLFLLNATGV